MTNDDTVAGGAKPTIIELSADDVVDEDGVNSGREQSAPPPPPRHKPAPRSRMRWSLVALAIAAAVAGAWLYRTVLASYFPTDAQQSALARIETLEAQTKTLNDQLTALANQSEQLRGTLANSAKQAEDASAGLSGLAAKTADGENRLAAVEAEAVNLKAALAKLQTQPPESSSAAPAAADPGALAALTQRVVALEKDLAGLKAARTPDDTAERNAALMQTLSDLKAKIAAGTGYQAEFDRLARLVPAAGGLDKLAAHAGEGLPDAEGLGQQLQSLAASLPAPDAAPAAAEEGYMSGLWNVLESVVTIRTVGEANWPDLATRGAALASAGDLAGAITLISKAEGEKPVPLSQWLERARARLALEETLIETETSVRRQIAGATP